MLIEIVRDQLLGIFCVVRKRWRLKFILMFIDIAKIYWLIGIGCWQIGAQDFENDQGKKTVLLPPFRSLKRLLHQIIYINTKEN